MGIAITSICENNPSSAFAFHVFAEQIGADNLARLGMLERRYGHAVTIHSLGAEKNRLAALPKPPRLPTAVYNRLLICESLRSSASRVLYLDADLVCLANIDALRDLNLDGNILAAVEDFDQAERKKAIDWIHDALYFNSGVLLIDIERWNACDITPRTMAKINELGRKSLIPEQDALNIAIDGRVLYLARAWNLQRDIYPLSADTKFLHFSGHHKPWQVWSPNHHDEHFATYLKLSPWADWRFSPASRKHRKRLAQHLFRHGPLTDAAWWYLRYALTMK